MLDIRQPARQAIACRRVRICCVEINLARTTGRYQGTLRADRQDVASVAIERIRAVAAIVSQSELLACDQVDCDVSLEDLNVGMLANFLGQRLLNSQAGCVRDMNHPAGAVPTFSRQMVAGFVSRKGDALIDEPFDRSPAVFDNKPRGHGIIEECTCSDCVLNVGFNRILAIENGGYAALCPARRAVFQAALADQTNFASFCEPQCCRLACQTAANHENIEMVHHSTFLLEETSHYITCSRRPIRRQSGACDGGWRMVKIVSALTTT